MRRNVSSPESCEFYGVADAISGCRVPRSCQDCLAMSGCGIASSGVCRNATDLSVLSYDGQPPHDYRNATFPDGSLVSNNSTSIFLAGTATYCKATDPVCVKCRNEFQDILSRASVSLGTQFCKGDNGCVCIGICEVPEQRTPSVLDTECGQPIEYRSNRFKPARDVRSVLNDGRGDPRAARIPVKFESTNEDSCAFAGEIDIRGCRVPRTCQSCLQKPGCMISEARCIDMEDGRFLHYFSGNIDSNGMGNAYSWYFPSSNMTYCPLSDATCATCRKLFPNPSGDDWGSIVWSSRFCVGQGGCVCIQACEDDRRSRGVYDPDCNQIFGFTPDATSPAISLGIAVATWLALLFIYRCLIRESSSRHPRVQANRPMVWRNMLDEVPALARMDLFGWRAYREELMLREQELLHGLDVTRPLGNTVDFEFLDPSAPDFDEEDASAPTAHDPKALASAPVYRRSFHEDDEGTANESRASTYETDDSAPSAPGFDPEELEEWLRQPASLCESDRRGLITRRWPRRNQE